jgi:protein gp88
MMTVASRYNVPESELVTHLVEDRRASLSPWGRGNSKLGPGIYTYSKLPGRISGTCPGSSGECELICFAKKVVHNKPVWQLWADNTARGDELPPLPADAKTVRIHVSGDFDTQGYIASWIQLARSRPEVQFFGYTRSWRVKELLPLIDMLDEEPNVNIWASIDQSIEEMPPGGFRRAWIEGDPRLTKLTDMTYRTFDGQKAVVCPEQSGFMPNCQTCKLCFHDNNLDLVFLKH